MRNEYLKLVEELNIKDPIRDLTKDEMKFVFKGWFVARHSDDPNYQKNNIEIISENFYDETIPVFGEPTQSNTLIEQDFQSVIKEVNQRLKPAEDVVDSPEEGDPTDNNTDDEGNALSTDSENEDDVQEELIEKRK